MNPAKPSDPSSTRSDVTALTAIAAERQRQRDVEGWSSDHDDGHSKGELAAAAACYAVGRCIVEGSLRISERGLIKNLWPWSAKWWKPKDRRRNLVRAGALIVAEIERIDRLETHEIRRK